MKKKIKKVQKPLFTTLALYFYFFNFLQVYASLEKLSFVRSYHSLRSLEVKANNFGGNV